MVKISTFCDRQDRLFMTNKIDFSQLLKTNYYRRFVPCEIKKQQCDRVNNEEHIGLWVQKRACNEVFEEKKSYPKNVDSGNAIGESLALREAKLETSPSLCTLTSLIHP